MSQRRPETRETIELLVPPELDQRALVALIEQRFSAERAPESTGSCRLFESFDWRLYNAGLSLQWCFAEATAPTALLRDLRKPDPVLAQQPMPTAPGLLEEMPPGPVRERLAPLLEMRRLLPMLDLISQQTPFRLLNEDDKTVVRLVIEQNRFRDPSSGRAGTLMRRLRLQGVRGYAEHLEQAQSLLLDELGFTRLREPLAVEALLAAGHRPGAYSSKLDERLEPTQRADLATKQILRGLLHTLEANIEGARAGLDSEFLHDLRVATRRTRSALSQIKGVFPEEEVADFKQRFAWLQQVTGPVRDLDVYLLDLPAMAQRLPVALRDDLNPLREQLLGHHAEAQRQLARELASAPFERLLRDWHAFLDAPVPAAGAQQAAPRRAALPIKRVADQRIRKLLKQVRAEGRAITEDSPPQDLHELRKRCKKLRYLMEFFQSLYPKDRIREQIKQTKQLLDNLGRFQDTAVQVQHLRTYAEEGVGEAVGASVGLGLGNRRLPARTLLAMGALIGQLLADQACAREAFREVFAEFDSPANVERFKALLKGEAQQAPEPESPEPESAEPGVAAISERP